MNAAALSYDYPIRPLQRTVGNVSKSITCVSHSLVPLQSDEHRTEDFMLAKAVNVNTKQERAPIHEMSERDVAEVIGEALIIDFGQYRGTHKHIARAAGVKSEKTAENWAQKFNLPGAMALLKLMAESPSLRKEISRLTAMESTLDPAAEAALQQFISVMQRGKQ